MNSVRIAVIGIGNMGFAHASNIYAGKVPGMQLTALCDTDEAKRNAAAESFAGVAIFADHISLLDAHVADAVIIATPHYFHPPIAIDAFARGYHVITEKPAGVNAGAVREMTAAAEASGRVFGIMFNQRTNPLFARTREIVKSGQLGLPKRFSWIITNWYRTQHYYDSGDWRATWRGEGGGVLLNQAPHNLDIWQWIFGMPSSLWATCRVARHHRIEVEDEATICAEYDNGASAVFITSTGEFPGTNRLEIVGDRGKIVLENGVLKWWRLHEPEREFCFKSQKSFDKIPFDYEEIKPEEKETGHLGILQNFAEAVLTGSELLAPGSDGIYELMISNAAYLSSWQDGRRITLPPDDAEFLAHLKSAAETSSIKHTNDSPSTSGSYSERWQVRW